MAESLPIPAIALTDADSLEIARIWSAKGGQHVTLAATTWQDPVGWGAFLVDFMSQVADSYVAHGWDREEAMSRILAGFEKQIRSVKDQPSGGFVDF